jgi:hypothetical protein
LKPLTLKSKNQHTNILHNLSYDLLKDYIINLYDIIWTFV